MHRIDTAGATNDNKFTEGNPTTGVPATVVSADWLTAVQEEILAVLDEAGIEPSKVNNSQLKAAILSLIAGGGAAVSAGGVSIIDSGDFFADGNVEAALQQLAEKIYSGTINAGQLNRSIVSLAGATHQSDVAHAEALVDISHTSDVTYTVRADSQVATRIGTAIQVAQGGAGRVAIVAGAGVTIRKGASFAASTLEQEAIIVLVKVAANTWRLGGALAAA